MFDTRSTLIAGRVSVALAALALTGGPSTTASADEGPLERMTAATVLIYPDPRGASADSRWEAFAGVVVGPDLVLTTLDAIGGRPVSGSAPEPFVSFRPPHPRGRSASGFPRSVVPSTLADFKPNWGLALLRVKVPAGIEPAKLGERSLRIGERAVVIAHEPGEGLWATIRAAVERGAPDAGRIPGLDLYRIDHPPAWGNSGAPLFGLDGRLHGLLLPAEGRRPAGAVAARVLDEFLLGMAPPRPRGEAGDQPALVIDDRT